MQPTAVYEITGYLDEVNNLPFPVMWNQETWTILKSVNIRAISRQSHKLVSTSFCPGTEGHILSWLYCIRKLGVDMAKNFRAIISHIMLFFWQMIYWENPVEPLLWQLWESATLIQRSADTMTPLGTAKIVTKRIVTLYVRPIGDCKNCHCNRLSLYPLSLLTADHCNMPITQSQLVEPNFRGQTRGRIDEQSSSVALSVLRTVRKPNSGGCSCRR